MKKTVLILAPLLLAVLLLVLAAQLWLRPRVENQIRQALAGLTSFDGSPVQSGVEVLDFSPLTRKLLLRGLELRMVNRRARSPIRLRKFPCACPCGPCWPARLYAARFCLNRA